MEGILGDFDESYGLDEPFQTVVDHYRDVFDDSIDLEPMKTGSRRRLGEALLEYRDAPRVGDELSPTQWMFGRRQRLSLIHI